MELFPYDATSPFPQTSSEKQMAERIHILRYMHGFPLVLIIFVFLFYIIIGIAERDMGQYMGTALMLVGFGATIYAPFSYFYRRQDARFLEIRLHTAIQDRIRAAERSRGSS